VSNVRSSKMSGVCTVCPAVAEFISETADGVGEPEGMVEDDDLGHRGGA
jgi:hypothetical protein